jgi:hypothetical protein
LRHSLKVPEEFSIFSLNGPYKGGGPMMETVTWPLYSNTSFSCHQRLSEAEWHNIKYYRKEAVFAHLSMELSQLKGTPCVKADVGVQDKIKHINTRKHTTKFSTS